MDTSISLDQVVSATGASLSQIHWITDPDRKANAFGIGFRYSRSENHSVLVTVDLAKCKNKGNGGGRRALPSRIATENPATTKTWEF
jgi:hypothetical protein